MFGIKDSNTQAEIDNDLQNQESEKQARINAQYDLATVKNHQDIIIEFGRTVHKNVYDDICTEVSCSDEFKCAVMDVGLQAEFSKKLLQTLKAKTIKVSFTHAFFDIKEKLIGDYVSLEDLIDAAAGE